jgi:hypothetical protein
VLRKTLEGWIGVDFRPDFGSPTGDGGVISGYACGRLVPMWERGDGWWKLWRIGQEESGESGTIRTWVNFLFADKPKLAQHHF